MNRPAAIRLANLAHAEDQAAVLLLVDAYAQDAMGDGRPLSPTARARLIPGLRAHPTTRVLLAWEGTHAVGIAVCFLGFSTFAARPLLNIHDLAILPSHRRQGISRQLLESAADLARSLDCCKLTLEVLEHNRRARDVYERAGFRQAVYQEAAGGALFLTKPL